MASVSLEMSIILKVLVEDSAWDCKLQNQPPWKVEINHNAGEWDQKILEQGNKVADTGKSGIKF